MALLEIIGICLISTFGVVNKFQDKKFVIPPPSLFEYSYILDENDDFVLTSPSGTEYLPFGRSVDGSYYNYTHTASSSLPFSVDMVFRRPTNSWSEMYGFYVPSSGALGYIGSPSSVGSVSKMGFIFDNTTNYDYLLSLDFEGSGDPQSIQLTMGGSTEFLNAVVMDETMTTLTIGANNSITINSNVSSSASSFKGFYLTSLGVNPSYDDGYSDGVDHGEVGFDLTFLFEKIVGVLINFSMIFLGLEVMGISLIDVFGILLLIISVVWVFKLIKGG